MIDHQPLIDALQAGPLSRWAQLMPAQIERGLDPARWGDLPDWQTVLARLPALTPSSVDLRNGVRIGCADDCSPIHQQQLGDLLMQLHPWRKGPLELFGLPIDTEWRSDWKWERLKAHLAPLENRLVLDVGCGNGYHCWRMYGAGARRVIGIDPSPRYVHQFYALKHFIGPAPVDVLPVGVEDIPGELRGFDTVFSMGVLYHRRSPMDHLIQLRDCLRSGGQLVLETLVVDGAEGHCLVPEGRYGKMRNVWFIPSPPTLLSWLRKCGLRNPRVVDVTPTTVAEQRSTPWMTFESLLTFLDPGDPSRTVEGHPAPQRAVIIAEA